MASRIESNTAYGDWRDYDDVPMRDTVKGKRPKMVWAQVVTMVQVGIGGSVQLLTTSEADSLYDCLRAALQDR